MNLYVLVGNIGSGKSTLVKEFLGRQENKTVCVCRDSLRYMVGGGEYTFDPELEPAIIEANLHIVESFMEIGTDIVVDEVNVSIEYRNDFLELGEYYKYKKIAIVPPTLSREESVNRRMNNPHGQPREVWYQVWDKFNGKYEEPTLEEGFDEVRAVCRCCGGLGEDIEWGATYTCGICNGSCFVKGKRK